MFHPFQEEDLDYHQSEIEFAHQVVPQLAHSLQAKLVQERSHMGRLLLGSHQTGRRKEQTTMVRGKQFRT